MTVLLSKRAVLCALGFALCGCHGVQSTGDPAMRKRVDRYATVRLGSDLSGLSKNQRRMLPLLIEAARSMDDAFKLQAYGDLDGLVKTVPDPATRRFVEINYGPWDRLEDNAPFVEGVGSKPRGANFYPHDMSREDFEGHIAAHPQQADALKSLYTMVRRDDAGALRAIPYSQFFSQQCNRAAELLRQAAALAEDSGFKTYLVARAQALTDDEYRNSDMLWLDMKDNDIDIVVGPIENYEDQLFGYKTSFESYVLLKDRAWSQRLSRYATLLPELQRGLPVAQEYKQETPGSDAQLNAYDVIYYAGDCNAGSKTIAINLPNDETVQLEKGTRRLQLKNAMRAKYDRILVPLSKMLIAPDQRRHVTFNAFFANTMFHEVAHGLGIKNTINGRGTVRSALRELGSALEEGKADILGLYMVTKLFDQGTLEEGQLQDYYTTFLASIFRSVRFGAASAHGRANMLRFNYFKKKRAFSRSTDGTYRVDMVQMRQAMTDLSALILKLQGDGDYEHVMRLMDTMGNVGPQLQSDLDRLNTAGIPVDIVFEQGPAVLRL